MKKITNLILSVAIMFGALSFASCGANTAPNTEQTLEIFVVEAGYGSKWCEDLIALFKEQDWVKQKYPDLQIAFNANDLPNFEKGKLDAGEKNNTIDLIFGTHLQKYADPDSGGKTVLLDLAETVYNQLVPGEELTVKQKMVDSYVRSNLYIDIDETASTEKYYYTSWASGMSGIIYNEAILTGLGIKVPNTTNELISACGKIQTYKYRNIDGNEIDYAFIQAKDDNYWNDIFPTWWAQYNGVNAYYDFWDGVDEGSRSKNIFTQTGRVKSLEVFQEVLDYSKGYITPSSFTYEYMTAQTNFLKGNGVFHVNGDWFYNEMSKMLSLIKQEYTDYNYEFKMMRTPIVSAIVEYTPSIISEAATAGISPDNLLSLVIDAIDLGEESYGNVLPEDYEYIKQARAVVNSIGAFHMSVIPEYANGKEVAADFLKFMATDIANESYIKSTSGASLPYKYDVKAKNPVLYNSLPALQRSRLDYFDSPHYDINVLPSITSFPLVKYGNLTSFKETDFFATFRTNGNTKDPQDFYDETIRYWDESNRWLNALNAAGLQ